MIPVYQPWLTNLEKQYLDEAYESNWISSNGPFIEKAEELFANFVNAKHCILTSSGTTALHLCLRALDLPHFDGDTRNNMNGIVIIPDTTFVATAFAASYDNRAIKIVDINKDTWNINIDAIEKLINDGYNVDAVIPVHLYGNPADMARLNELKNKHGFKIIEDACEAIGATIGSKHVGTFSDAACFSFYGNKTLTCGEGGAVITNNDEIANRAKLLRGQAQDINKRYWHVDIGFNYRITNMQAAILYGQLKRSDNILEEKDRVANRYTIRLRDHINFQKTLINHKHSNWLVTVELPVEQEKVATLMRENGVDVRKVFYPISTMPPYVNLNINNPNANKLSMFGLSLPSYPQLTNNEIDFICDTLLKSISNVKV